MKPLSEEQKQLVKEILKLQIEIEWSYDSASDLSIEEQNETKAAFKQKKKELGL